MSDYLNDLMQKYVNLSGHLSASYNLNNGLPWTNPLKIGIGSDQHIVDTTINRGLMMLLNNDYYLDAKETLISQQISGLYQNTNLLHQVLSAHIKDEGVHGTDRITYNNYFISGSGIDSSLQQYNNSIALKDYLIYLPITWSASKINQKIASIPHNLNGHTVVFMFVIPDSYQQTENQYIMDVGNYCISFSNFINGILFVIGDFLHQTKINGKVNFQKFTKKTPNQINDPEKYDGIILKKFIQKLYKEIDNPETSQQIQAYHTPESYSSLDLNKIIIKGSALNSYYSIINFNQIKSKVYVKNLAFHSSLQTYKERTEETDIINIESALNFNMPSDDKFLIHWPLNQFTKNTFSHSFKPIIGQSFKQYIQQRYNSPVYNAFNNYLNCINQGTNIISSFFYLDGYTTKVNSFKHMIKSSPISSAIKLLSSYVSLKPNVYKNDPTQYHDVQITGRYSISQQIYQVSSSLIPISTKQYLLNSINESFSATKRMNESIPTFIINPNVSIDAKQSIKQVTQYSQNLKLFYSNISSVIYSEQFSEFLRKRPDLYTEDPFNQTIKGTINNSTVEDLAKLFCQKYNIDGIFSSYDQILTMIESDVIDKLTDLDRDTLVNALTLNDNGKGTCISFNNIIPQNGTCDASLKSNYSNNSVDAVLLTSNVNQQDWVKNYFTFNNDNNQFIRYVGEILFSQKYYQWEDLHQRGTTFLPPTQQLPYTQDYKSSPMFDSTYDSTLTFWTKMQNPQKNNVDYPFISFYVDDEFKFSINYDSFKTMDLSKLNEDIIKVHQGNLSGSVMLNQIQSYISPNSGFYPWVFWTVKIDKTSNKYYFKNDTITNLPDLSNTISLKVDAYIYKKDGNRFNIQKFALNEKQFNPDKGISSYTKNYIFKSINDDQLAGFNMKIGLECYPNSNYFKSNNQDQKNNKSFYNGYFRDFMLFKGHLTQIQQMNLFSLGILTAYDFPTQYQSQTMSGLISSGKFFIGLVSIYDSSDINIINCDTKYNGHTYRVN